MKQIAAVVAVAITLLAMPTHAQQYVVKLGWTASSDAAANPSLTYNVYRAPTCAGPFAMLNSTSVAGTSFVDTGVAAGATYCYRVTSVLAGIEGSPSNQVVAAVPPPFDRQAACAHRGPIVGWIRCLGSRPRRLSSPPSH